MKKLLLAFVFVLVGLLMGCAMLVPMADFIQELNCHLQQPATAALLRRPASRSARACLAWSPSATAVSMPQRKTVALQKLTTLIWMS